MVKNTFFITLIFILGICSCDKSSPDTNKSGEVFKKYVLDGESTEYVAEGGSFTRFRVGIDTTTSVDTFRMTISKIFTPPTDSLNLDSTYFDSKVRITNLLGWKVTFGVSFTNILTNATYSNLFPSSTPSAISNLVIKSESKGLLSYSYTRTHGVGDISKYTGRIRAVN